MPPYLTDVGNWKAVWPLFLTALLLIALFFILIRPKEERKDFVLIVLAFSMLGLVAGYLTGFSRESAVGAVLPAVPEVVTVAVSPPPPPPPGPPPPPPPGPPPAVEDVNMVGQSANKCLNVANGSTTPGDPIDILTCDGSAKQTFEKQFVVGDVFVLFSTHSNLCVDVPNGDLSSGAIIVQSTCTAAAHQQFTIDSGTLEIRPVHNPGSCLAVLGNATHNGADVVQWVCNGQTNQQWVVNVESTLPPPPPPPPRR